MSVNKLVDGIISREAGYVNHPSDPGGATNWGITQNVARANGYSGHMRDLPKSVAIDIYIREYINRPKFNLIFDIDPVVAEEVIDSGVNAGQSRAAKWFQQSLNVLNRRQVDYADVDEDGAIGPKTIAAFHALRKKRTNSRSLMLKCLNGLQFMHYYNLSAGNTKFEDFMVGWVDGRIS